MGDMKGDSGEMVRLNVGGVYYCTSKGTLLSQQDSVFTKMLAEKPQLKDERGTYYFIDRDGLVFRHVLNFLRDPENFELPGNFSDFSLLSKEAQHYGLPALADRLTSESSPLNYVELIETCHPEKIGVCSARLVLSDDLRTKAPFSEILESLPKDHDEYHGASGRFWIRTETNRLDLGVKLRKHGWFLVGCTAVNRRLPDITGQGTDLCHVVEKWCKM